LSHRAEGKPWSEQTEEEWQRQRQQTQAKRW
jgi:hypothetical protein